MHRWLGPGRIALELWNLHPSQTDPESSFPLGSFDHPWIPSLLFLEPDDCLAVYPHLAIDQFVSPHPSSASSPAVPRGYHRPRRFKLPIPVLARILTTHPSHPSHGTRITMRQLSVYPLPPMQFLQRGTSQLSRLQHPSDDPGNTALPWPCVWQWMHGCKIAGRVLAGYRAPPPTHPSRAPSPRFP